MWQMHDRLEGHLSEENCRSEIASFEKHGQLVPALGRRIRNDPRFEVELICGARRLFVARHLNQPLQVELRELSDLQAIIAIDIENRQRADVSPYERGLSFLEWIRSGYFGSQREIARTLQMSTTHVSRLMQLARLPSVILTAFDSPTSICEAWGLALLRALDNPQLRQSVIEAARALSRVTPRLAPKDVFRQLMAASRGRLGRKRLRDEVVLDDAGRPLFRVRRQNHTLAILLPIGSLSVELESRVRTVIADTLKGAAQRREPQPSAASALAPRIIRLVSSRCDADQGC
jgi:ParB family chromosome partitioning protein